MDDDRWQELASRLDHIERYLVELGQVTGYPFTPTTGAFGQAQFGQAPFDQAPFGQGPVGPGGPPVPPDLVAMAQAGKAIQAIKLYQRLTGMSLKEATTAIDQAAGTYRGR